MQLQENILFHDRYRLLKLLGRGGFSEVWLVEDAKTTMIVVLKIYASGTGLDEDGTTLFCKEFSLVYNFNHSNLLKPTYFDVYDRRPYLILPFCERGSTLKLAGNITEEDAWKFLHDVASGLAYLHKQNPPVIHQDIKPDNVLVDNVGQFMIADFGISTKVRSTLRKSVGQQTGGGTFAYMGPERFSRDNIPIKASDIWALGATLYELLTGDAPFRDHGGVLQKSGAEIPDIKGNLSPDLKNIVNLCLQKETWDRPTAEKIVTWTEKHFRKEKINFNFKPTNAGKGKPTDAGKGKPVIHDKGKPTVHGKPAGQVQPGVQNKTGLITVICVVVILLVALIIGIGVHTQEKKQRMQELYSQFDDYKRKGDGFYSKGENGYKEALDMYDKALEVAEKIEKSGETVSGRYDVSKKKDDIAAEIEEIFSDLVQRGDRLSRLSPNGDEISKLQAIANYEEALKWKDDVNVKNKLNRLK
jgi:hypothetical protein